MCWRFFTAVRSAFFVGSCGRWARTSAGAYPNDTAGTADNAALGRMEALRKRSHLALEEDGTQRRQIQEHGIFLVVHRDHLREHSAAVPDVRAAVHPGVGIEHLRPRPGARYAHTVAQARH